ncbi:MAG: hypothetical protein B6I28_03655 [Fusobacteriia bacterium 4572_132]|nr:MAG: hypothetical protein B6I28_03655 [Fusobacteriia bacterium 4572_132]
MRTFYVAISVILYFLMSVVFYLPIAIIMGQKKGKKWAKGKAKEWGKFIINRTGSKVNVIIKDEKTLEKIKDKAIVVISNHQSNMDIPLIMGYFPKKLAFVAKKEMETWPIIGMWMRKIECIFLDRSDRRAGMRSIKEGVEKIKNGDSVVIFPEGTRSKTGEIEEFKKGSFKLASDPGVHIVPVTIKGTIDIMGKGNKNISKVENVQLIIDKPIDTSKMDKMEKKELADKVRDIIIKNYKEIGDEGTAKE